MEFLWLSQPFLVTAAIVTAVALLVSSAALLRRKSRPRRRYHPVAGTIFHQVIHFPRLYDYHTELSRRLKSFRISTAPFRSDVYTSDPVVVEYILNSNFRNYGKGALNHDIFEELLGDGIFAVDGGKWRHQRKLASYEFSRRSLREHSCAVFRKNAAKLAETISLAARSRQAVEIQDLFMKSAMDSIFEIAFGVELNCLQEYSAEENRRFVTAVDEANLQTNWRYFNPFWKIMRFFGIGSEAALKDNIRVIDEFVYKLIRHKIARLSGRSRSGIESDDPHDQSSASKVAGEEDLLSRFMVEGETDPKTMNIPFLRDIALSFLIAGKDTTAGTLSWFFAMLCRHPSVEEKVVREIDEAVEADETATFQDFAESIGEESLNKMHYLHAALTETLRLYPAVGIDGKVCFSDDTLPDGFNIQAGESISFQAYPMGRMEYIWGPDAEAFRPERWLDANGNFCAQSPYKFTAFQAGPRICLGKEFAYRQMKIFTAVLLRHFVFQLRNEEEILSYKMSLTLLVDGGLYLCASRRRGQRGASAMEADET